MNTKISTTLYTSVDFFKYFSTHSHLLQRSKKCGFKLNRVAGEISQKDHCVCSKIDKFWMTRLNCPLRLGETISVKYNESIDNIFS